MPLRRTSIIAALDRLTRAFRLRSRAVERRLRRIPPIVLVMRTVQEMSDDDATHMSASVAYYVLFSIFPLLLGIIAVLSFFQEPQEIQSQLTEFAGDYLPGSRELIDTNVDAVLRFRGALGVFAILGLFWSGSAIFGAVTRAVNRAWDVHTDRPLFISKPRQLAMAVGVGVLFGLSVASATFARLAEGFAEYDVPGVEILVNVVVVAVLQGTSFLFTLLIFLLIYKFMPNTRTYWRYIWPGAVVAAVLFEAAKNMFILYLGRFASFENVYGSLTPVIVLLLWAYLSSLILILGAELSSEYGRMRRGVGRGVLLHPQRRTSRPDPED